MTNEIADLELSIKHCESSEDESSSTFAIEMRFAQPDSDSDVRVGYDKPVLAHLDFKALDSLAGDPATYAKGLTERLFAEPSFRTAFAQVRASSQSSGLCLRMRLMLDNASPALHNVRWESLLDPDRGSPLFTGEEVFLSRFLVSQDWRPVKLRPKGDLRALAAIANPANLAEYSLAPVDVQGETDRVRKVLNGITVNVLPEAGGRCSLNNLVDCLRSGNYDILYLVCHGAYVRQEPWLWLEDEDGRVARIPGNELANRIAELQNGPRLVVLASCQSAGNTAGSALTALGPRLSQAGVPAVLAMQGNITMQTVEKFMPVFFAELMKDGQIDRALAVARGMVRDHFDYWMPVLYMRLKSGRLWYTPGFSSGNGSGRDFEKWPGLIKNLRKGLCTPIIGHGILDSLVGATREVSTHWAERFRYPMEKHERDHLPQVAHYLSVHQDLSFTRDELMEDQRRELIARFGPCLSPDLKKPAVELDDLFRAVVQSRSSQDALEPHQVLAGLPLPIYLTTNYNDLLAEALRAAGREPQVLVCPWNEYIECDYEDGDISPTPEKPLVYHLFGRFDQPDSMVLTEDDYFDFLIGVTRNKQLIPTAVRRALTDRALLFLGFRLDQSDFRVLYRFIVGQEGGGRRSRYTHVGVQLDQEGDELIDAGRARQYLATYFQGADISLYWGSAEDFSKDLSAQWKATQ